MLAAKRDPFHSGANDHYSPKAPRLVRALSALQIAGTLLAVPVGLGSAYSVYRANFSVEITCQNLRANIVAMLDRNVDPNARHMLVRRDVEAFEQDCRQFDPDATAAFRTLLAVDKKVPVVVPPTVAAVSPKADAVVKSDAKVDSKNDTKAETVVRKIETRPALAAKQPAASVPVAETKPTQRDLATSDAAWLSAVRQALVKNEPDPSLKRAPAPAPAAVASIPPAAAPGPQPVASPSLEKRSLGELRTTVPAPPVSLAAPAPESAPVLPPATPVANAAAPPADDGHHRVK